MKHNSAELWIDFTNALKQEIEGTHIDILGTAWESNAKRTSFYLELLLPKIATKLNLGFEREKTFRVDATFYRKAANDYQVPIIFIETENNSSTTETEIYKLCCLNAPLKVIFICLEWNNESRKDITEDYWQYIIDAFVAENRLVGHLGVIVAEWMDTLKLHGFAYNEKGKIDEEKIICEI